MLITFIHRFFRRPGVNFDLISFMKIDAFHYVHYTELCSLLNR